MKNYTVIYRDINGELKESWHHLTENNIEYVKNQYKKAQKEIVHFVEKTLSFGEYLKKVK